MIIRHFGILISVIKMSRIPTLSSMAELRCSGFGQPSPRHGLRLLYWFVNECVEVSRQSRMMSLCTPSTGDFGFRIFHNRDEGGHGSLLPGSRSRPYYELGNLSALGAKSLPDYVREKYTGFQDKSNSDRIIVCLESGTFRSVYVSRHETRTNFDPSHTFCIGLELVRSIKNTQREDFLRAAKRRRTVWPRWDTMLRAEPALRNHLLPRSAQSHHLLTPHRAPSHQPHSQEIHLLPAAPHTHSRKISTCWFLLLVLLTAAASFCLLQSTCKDHLCP